VRTMNNTQNEHTNGILATINLPVDQMNQ